MRRRAIIESGLFASLAGLAACQSKEEVHANALTPSSSVVSQRVLQTRRFDTRDDTVLMQAAIGVLQDLGFIIEESRAQAGLVTGIKERDATEAGQVAGQLLLVLLAAAARTQHRVVMDRDQVIRAQVVVRSVPDRSGMLARVTFQRLVRNTDGQVSRLETIEDPELYKGFFNQLAQSTFLAAHEI
ncbi:hypothetical protein [Roseomonas populi]|uniref:Uncharacterized protein n=1 Tax=Roseomonas populi TaxID=3121582 RepID=A0ABT1X2C2_9PROT|nr:hypothetical protein [Roseomonas pecuniae]MCR0982256.1 hypothetical protein [Roseomonas pecuniae]